MSHDFHPYPAYTSTEYGYLGDLPSQWSHAQVRRAFQIENGATPRSDVEEYWSGDIPWATPDDLGHNTRPRLADTRRRLTRAGLASCGARLVPQGSLILSTRAPVGYVAIANQPVSTNQGCRALTPTRHLDPRYFYYYFLGAADVLDGFSAGSTFRELSTSTLAQFRIPLPSAEEQSQIAAFLDYETARIDRLIENQQRLIALLEEKRQAVISHAVTKGLDPDVPMKDSGVEWLGDIPSQWKPLRLKHVGNVVDCKHKTPEYVEDGYPLVSTTEVKPGVLDLSLVTRRVSREDYEDMSDGRQPERGDIVYSRNASLGAAAFVDTDHPFCMGQDVVLIKPERSDGEFLTYALNSHRVARQVEAASIGATFKRLNVEDIKRFWLAIPPHEEQRCIAQDLTYRLQRFIAIVRKARAATELLHEHRTALISATVTGKIDVRDWQPPQSANEAEERDERLLQAADERASYD